MLLEGAPSVAFLRYLNLTPTQRGLSPPLTTFWLWLPRRMSSCSYSSFKRSCNRACGSKSSFESNSRLSCGSKSRFLCGSSGRFLSNIRSSFSRSFSSSSQALLREPPRGGVAHAHALAETANYIEYAVAITTDGIVFIRISSPSHNHVKYWLVEFFLLKCQDMKRDGQSIKVPRHLGLHTINAMPRKTRAVLLYTIKSSKVYSAKIVSGFGEAATA
ncbi:hypothetical protein CEP51_016790 [Fusarium floridanum]|uniref:Uncharacterized protein n=1 Tax=Fusarium floridanum TaxID=1325733 RepID=A0A428NFU1_9HYPO|nr:hypothetical protein CEP51_016790 [Fusarium floridanum]